MELILGTLAMLSSVAAAVFGLGGGLILISFLPDFLPAGAIVPVHGVTQLASNAGRAIFSYRTVQYRLLPKFLVGSLFGAALFGMVVVTISTEYIPLFIGLYILIK